MGWNTEHLCEVLGVLNEAYALEYEIKNSYRGCYSGCTTYPALKDYIQNLARRLEASAEYVDSIPEDEEPIDEQ